MAVKHIKIDTSNKHVSSEYVNRLLVAISRSAAPEFYKYTILKNSIKIYWSYDISFIYESLTKALEEIE